jgi:hypothetical protein
MGPELEEKLHVRHKVQCVAQVQGSPWLQCRLPRSGASHKNLWALREQPSTQRQSSSVLVPYTPTLPKQDWSGTLKSSPSLHNEGVGLWSWPHASSTLGKWCIQSPSGCPTKVQEIHPPQGSTRESMIPHQPMQIQCCPAGHNDKSENQSDVSVQR